MKGGGKRDPTRNRSWRSVWICTPPNRTQQPPFPHLPFRSTSRAQKERKRKEPTKTHRRHFLIPFLKTTAGHPLPRRHRHQSRLRLEAELSITPYPGANSSHSSYGEDVGLGGRRGRACGGGRGGGRGEGAGEEEEVDGLMIGGGSIDGIHCGVFGGGGGDGGW